MPSPSQVSQAVVASPAVSFNRRVIWLPSGDDLALLAVQGSVVGAGSIMLLVTAVRYLPAPEVSLVYRLELVLGPLWVWAVLGEIPAPATILAGGIVATTLTVHSVLGLQADRQAAMGAGRLAPVDRASPDEVTVPKPIVDR